MTIQAFAFASESFFDNTIVGRFLVELCRTGVTIQTDRVIVGLAHFDWQFVGAGACLPDMAQSGLLRLEGAQNSIVGMATVAVFTLDVPILIMYR